jgi:probable phosphoglycerate mutase
VIAMERAEGTVRNASISQFLARGDRLELVRYNAVDHLPSL